MVQDNTNRDAVLSAIWGNPAPLMGGEWRPATGGKAWEYIRGGEWEQRGAVRLMRTSGGVGIRVYFNTGSHRTSERPDILEYVQQRDGLAGFAETLQAIAKVYGLSLELSASDRQVIHRRELARELAASFIEALRLNPDGETAQYIRARHLEADGVHLGEFTPESLNRAKEGLKARGKKPDIADFKALGLTEDRALAGYNCVIPYYHNGIVQGIVLRNIKGAKTKYLKSEGLGRPGYCDRLEPGTPAVFVEGELDALSLIQQGVKNVVGIGGAVIGDEIARVLRARGINEVVYIPDAENDEHGRKKLKTARDCVRALTTAEVEGEPVIKSLMVLELPTPTGPNGKTDANSYSAEHPGAIPQMLEFEPVAAWSWELEQLRAETAADSAAGRRVDVGTLHEKVTDIYNRTRSPYVRQQVRTFVKGCADLAAYGITPESLEDLEGWNRQREYNNRIRQAAAELNKAVEDKAGPEVIGEIARRLAEVQGTNTRAEWEAQLGEPFEAELAALSEQPETLQTKWELGTVDKGHSYHEGEPVEFYPADLSIFCAATSHGKTAVMFSAAFDLLQRYPQKQILFVSCEENKRQLLQRAFSVFSDIPTTDTGKEIDGKCAKEEDKDARPCFITRTRKRTIKAILTGGPAPYKYNADGGEFMGRSELFEGVKKRFLADVERYGREIRPRLKFVHTDASAESITANIEYYVKKIQDEGGEIGAVFVDYMQLLTSEARTFSRHDELKDICKALHECAGRTELPFIMAAQLNREVLRPSTGTNTPLDNITVSNIGEGADIERIAHDVYLVWQVNKTPAGWYMKAPKSNDEYAPAPALDLNKIAGCYRLNRLFTRSNGRELKSGYLYIEQLKGRDGETGSWGLLPFDGERGLVMENDKNKMEE